MPICTDCSATGGCRCAVDEGTNVTITGTGATDDPWIINAADCITVYNFSDDFDLDVEEAGAGSCDDPFIINVGLAGAGHNHDGGGVDAVILGGDTQTTDPEAAGVAAVAIGNNAFAPGDNSIAVGPSAVADVSGCVALGNQAAATDTDAVAIGNQASANFPTAVALGFNASADGEASVALGDSSNTSATNASAVGMNAHADEIDATAIGANTDADALDATAIGAGAAAHAEGSTALGSGTNAAHMHATALGWNVGTSGTDQVNIGQFRLFQGAPNSATADSEISPNQLSFYLNEAGNALMVKVKYADGVTIKLGTIALV